MFGLNKLAVAVVVTGLVIGQNGPTLWASPTGGAKSAVHQVLAYETDIFNVEFRADEEASVLVSGDGDTDLDLFVYDENGNLIDSDIDASDDCVVSFTPKWTGNFRIEVRNLGNVYNEYTILAL